MQHIMDEEELTLTSRDVSCTLPTKTYEVFYKEQIFKVISK